jgi:primosomal protein N' (replication factor Y)
MTDDNDQLPYLRPPSPEKALRRVPVLLPYPLAGPFDYLVPPDVAAGPGDVVVVPLNRREVVGVVWDTEADARVPAGRLRPIVGVLETQPVATSMRRFIDWVAAYTLSPPGEVMAMALRVVHRAPALAPTGWRLAEDVPANRLTEARRRVIAQLTGASSRTTADLAAAAGVSGGVIRAMAQAGLLVRERLAGSPAFGRPNPDYRLTALSPDQAAAAEDLRAAVAARDFSVTLLDGVTGSGKTEVYFEAVAEAIRAGRQTLVLLPEIALS